METKNSKGIITLVIILGILVALLTGYIVYDKILKEDDQVKKNDEIKDIVYSSFNKETSDYSYNIPTINIDSTDVEKINAEINKDYKEEVEKQINNGEIVVYEVDYNYYVNSNVLSLVITGKLPSDIENYQVFNVDIYTGKSITNDELLNYKNISSTEFLSKLPDIYKNKYIDLHGTKESYINGLKNAPAGWTEEEIKSHEKRYTNQLNNTLDSENYSIGTPIFINSNNKLNIVATIYSLAGATAYDYILDIGL